MSYKNISAAIRTHKYKMLSNVDMHSILNDESDDLGSTKIKRLGMRYYGQSKD
ncbi:hypothetical protein GGQ84_001454 [Desulfitispora alkaliphila]|uniref:hypothetical protein n=1 Tax=Desulfitispora alkaliphila TaxID=622674 RepID=UPI003D20B580